MAGIVGIFLLICTLVFGGCSSLSKSGKAPQEVPRTPAEKKKAELLRQINRKFENPEAHFELGQLYQADGLWAKAEDEYRIVLNFNPVHREAQAARVKVLLDGGDAAKSELLTDIYMEQAANSALGSLQLALGFQKQGLDEYAFRCYQQALRLAPNSAKVNRQIGYYYLSKDDKERAMDYLSRSFQLNPNQPEVAGELGRLGVVVNIPRKTQKDTRKLDKTIEQYDEEIEP